MTTSNNSNAHSSFPSPLDINRCINLGDTEKNGFDMKIVAKAICDSPVKEQRVPMFLPKDNKTFPHMVLVPNFGTIIVVPDSLSEIPAEDVASLGLVDGGLLLRAPVGWRMNHLVRSLGVFESASQAAKNGWNMDIPNGLSQHIIRVNKLKGVITIFKVAS